EGLFGLLEQAFDASATFREGLERVTRMHRLINDVSVAHLERDADRARLVIRWRSTGQPASRHWAETYLATWIRRARLCTGVVLYPTAVRFRHWRPACLDPLHSFFGAPIWFGQLADEIELEGWLLSLPLVASRPELAVLLDRVTREALEQLPTGEDFAEDA